MILKMIITSIITVILYFVRRWTRRKKVKQVEEDAEFSCVTTDAPVTLKDREIVV